MTAAPPALVHLPVVKESTLTKFLYADAMPIAQKFVRFLERYCTRIAIAGSLRRNRNLVSDIEILFISKITSAPDPQDLFGDRKIEVSAAGLAIGALLVSEVITKRQNVKGRESWGPKNKLAVHVASGIPVDLFETTEKNWWNALVVRTGPADLNRKIASAAIARGWEWHAYGNGFTRGDGKSLIDRFVVKSEQDVFHHVGLPYQEPKDR
jgi:DNA polymerase/3'-5' exonuclease PolX